MSSDQQEEKFTVRSAIKQGMSWADHEDSPGWTARTPPKFSEEMPEITLDEEEYDRPKRTASAVGGSISVFVGGLDYGLDCAGLEAFFESKGVKVSRVRMPKGPTGKSTGRAFLNVADKATLEQIVKLDGAELSGRQLMIKEDSGPPGARTTRSSTKPQVSKFGGKWQGEQKPASSGGWQAVTKGGKIVDAPAIARKKERAPVVAKPATSETETTPAEAPSERKPLVLKPRSKPVGEADAERPDRKSVV